MPKINYPKIRSDLDAITSNFTSPIATGILALLTAFYANAIADRLNPNLRALVTNPFSRIAYLFGIMIVHYYNPTIAVSLIGLTFLVLLASYFTTPSPAPAMAMVPVVNMPMVTITPEEALVRNQQAQMNEEVSRMINEAKESQTASEDLSSSEASLSEMAANNSDKRDRLNIDVKVDVNDSAKTNTNPSPQDRAQALLSNIYQKIQGFNVSQTGQGQGQEREQEMMGFGYNIGLKNVDVDLTKLNPGFSNLDQHTRLQVSGEQPSNATPHADCAPALKPLNLSGNAAKMAERLNPTSVIESYASCQSNYNSSGNSKNNTNANTQDLGYSCPMVSLSCLNDIDRQNANAKAAANANAANTKAVNAANAANATKPANATKASSIKLNITGTSTVEPFNQMINFMKQLGGAEGNGQTVGVGPSTIIPVFGNRTTSIRGAVEVGTEEFPIIGPIISSNYRKEGLIPKTTTDRRCVDDCATSFDNIITTNMNVLLSLLVAEIKNNYDESIRENLCKIIRVIWENRNLPITEFFKNQSSKTAFIGLASMVLDKAQDSVAWKIIYDITQEVLNEMKHILAEKLDYNIAKRINEISAIRGQAAAKQVNFDTICGLQSPTGELTFEQTINNTGSQNQQGGHVHAHRHHKNGRCSNATSPSQAPNGMVDPHAKWLNKVVSGLGSSASSPQGMNFQTGYPGLKIGAEWERD